MEDLYWCFLCCTATPTRVPPTESWMHLRICGQKLFFEKYGAEENLHNVFWNEAVQHVFKALQKVKNFLKEGSAILAVICLDQASNATGESFKKSTTRCTRRQRVHNSQATDVNSKEENLE